MLPDVSEEAEAEAERQRHANARTRAVLATLPDDSYAIAEVLTVDCQGCGRAIAFGDTGCVRLPAAIHDDPAYGGSLYVCVACVPHMLAGWLYAASIVDMTADAEQRDALEETYFGDNPPALTGGAVFEDAFAQISLLHTEVCRKIEQNAPENA
jgi:hypothetical protein